MKIEKGMTMKDDADCSEVICPKCGSTDTVGTGAGDRYVKENMECYKCGHEWELVERIGLKRDVP